MKKRLIALYSLLSLAILIVLGLINYNDKYIKYDDIEKHISKTIGYKVDIQNNIKNKEEYFLYSYRGEDDKKYIGMAFFSKVFYDRYKLLGISSNDRNYGLYYSSNVENGIYQHFILYGENTNNTISSFQLDFGDKIVKEIILDENYYLKVYKFWDKDRGLPGRTFYDEYGNDITNGLLAKNLN